MKIYRILLVGFVLLSLVGCTLAVEPGTGFSTTPTSPATAVSPEGGTSTPAPSTAPSLAGTAWTLVSYGSPDAPTPVVTGVQSTLIFGTSGSVNGSGGCNSYGGQYTVQGDQISFQQIMHTMMACADEQVNQQEQKFLLALQNAGSFDISEGHLTIHYDNNQGALTFVSGAATPEPTSPATATVEATTAPTQTTSPTQTTAPTQMPTLAPTQPAATATQSGASVPPESASVYLDDRSSASGLIESVFQCHQPQRIPAGLFLLARPFHSAWNLRSLRAGLPEHRFGRSRPSARSAETPEPVSATSPCQPISRLRRPLGRPRPSRLAM